MKFGDNGFVQLQTYCSINAQKCIKFTKQTYRKLAGGSAAARRQCDLGQTNSLTVLRRAIKIFFAYPLTG